VERELAELIKISNATGKDTTLVQGGGGNTSVKTGDGKFMYIKASGTALKDMTAAAGWRRMRIEPVLDVIKDKELAKMPPTTREPEVVNRLLLACDDDVTTGARPSVEAHLHALLDKYIIHLHPIAVAAYVNAKKGRAGLEKLFAGWKYPPLWIPYTDPGFMLAKKVASLVGGYEKEYGRKPNVIVLAKHGLFVTADSADAAVRLVHRVVRLLKSNLPKGGAISKKIPSRKDVLAARFAVRKAIREATGQYLPVRFIINDTIAAFMARRGAAKLLSTAALNPDELVYANGAAMWVNKPDADVIAGKLKALIEKGQKPAAAFVVKGLGLFIAADTKAAKVIAEISTGSLQIRSWAAGFGGVLALTAREQNFISNWESEAFRKKLASIAEAGELKNRIAVVTGAGSGLGRSIAVGLARAGAIVAFADIDTKAAEETAVLIKSEIPDAATVVLACDVTDEKSVNAAFAKVLDGFGGLDILVNAAGIAPPFGLIDMPLEKWRLALDVNLTGYFLMARAAARIMVDQQMGGAIINLSSKSGLEPSKNNTAYTATKAAEIHAARGWALELGRYGIRVNSVAPGNVFEGSKIWNPAYIRACAKKYGIKPEEVIGHYVSKTALNREIKGVDIAEAIIFLCCDKARTITGQTLVADSGQVMVR